MKKILLVFTGGTICSSPDSEGKKNQSNAKKTSSYLENDYKKSASPFKDKVDFESVYLPQDILSENMTVNSWNDLLDIFKDKSIQEKYVGVIVMHGTDTLAYTSSLLSLVLAGYKIPVCMVSAQLQLKDEKTNGYMNFRASVELIMNGIAPNVYVVYRNLANAEHEPGEFLVHYGAHLLQCKNYSNNFHSHDEMTIDDISNAKLAGRAFETDRLYIHKIERLRDDVLLLQPYSSLRYDRICLDGLKAIVHGTYHSESVCIGRAQNPETDKNKLLQLDEVAEADRPFSILSLLASCKEKGICVALSPCDETAYSYGSTANALHCGAVALANTTVETAYAKALVGCALGKNGKDLENFLKESVNDEFVYKK